MTAVATTTKVCKTCGEAKSLTDFSPNKTTRDGLAQRCKPCVNEDVKRRRAQRIEQLGKDEVLRQEREYLARWRKRTGDVNNKEYGRIKRAATQRLIDLHRSEFEHLMLLARRGELVEVVS